MMEVSYSDILYVKGFCAAVTTEDIAKQDFILTPERLGLRYNGVKLKLKSADTVGTFEGRVQDVD
ncbi:MAG: hypothetical protein LBU99_07505 [Spirochaetaceae bacterium]|nr:hypothetical protein [Spirochaetaceae bacterium]